MWVLCIIQSLTPRSRPCLLPESVLLPPARQGLAASVSLAGTCRQCPAYCPYPWSLLSSRRSALTSWQHFPLGWITSNSCSSRPQLSLFRSLFPVFLIGITVFLSPSPLNYVESSLTSLYVSALEKYSTWQLSLKCFESVSFFSVSGRNLEPFQFPSACGQ